MIEKWATEKIEKIRTLCRIVCSHTVSQRVLTQQNKQSKNTHSNIDSESGGNDDDFVNNNARARAIRKTVQYKYTNTYRLNAVLLRYLDFFSWILSLALSLFQLNHFISFWYKQNS